MLRLIVHRCYERRAAKNIIRFWDFSSLGQSFKYTPTAVTACFWLYIQLPISLLQVIRPFFANGYI